MGDYSKAWVLLLEYVEKMALSDTTEVSLAALKALQVSKKVVKKYILNRPKTEFSKYFFFFFRK